MNLIHKENRASSARVNLLLGPLQRLSQLLDSAGDGIDLPKLSSRFVCQEVSKGRFSSSRRAVKNHRLNTLGGNETIQQFAGSQKMRLANEFGEFFRAHASREGQRLFSIGFFSVRK